MPKNAIIGQSGGPTAVINASLCGAFTECVKHPDKVGKVYGMVNGIDGFLKGKYIDLTAELNDEKLELLRYTPAAYLGSCRYKMPAGIDDAVYAELFKKFEELDIGYVFYNGGNDSMDTTNKLALYAAKIGSDIRVMGIPKTIDNDLVLTDHCPGFGSAAKFVAGIVRGIVLDADVYNNSVTIVEIMGRHAGWLTAAAVLARKFEGDNPVAVYLPEADFDMDKFLADMEEQLKVNKNVIVCISEGIHDKDGKFICEYESDARVDAFGHKALTGSGKYLENALKNRLPKCKVRSLELSVAQRCASGYASLADNNEAFAVGAFAAENAIKGETAKMSAIVREEGKAYKAKCVLVPASEVCNSEKPFPQEWITKDGTDIGPEFFDYCTPLMEGQIPLQYENGVPKFLYRK